METAPRVAQVERSRGRIRTQGSGRFPGSALLHNAALTPQRFQSLSSSLLGQFVHGNPCQFIFYILGNRRAQEINLKISDF